MTHIHKYTDTYMQKQICKYKYKYVNTITQIQNQGRIIPKREYMHEKLTFLFDGHIKWYWPPNSFLTHLSTNLLIGIFL